jgi:hypothetical protein
MLCIKGIKNIIKNILEYIDVEGASCLGSRGIKFANDTRTK